MRALAGLDSVLCPHLHSTTTFIGARRQESHSRRRPCDGRYEWLATVQSTAPAPWPICRNADHPPSPAYRRSAKYCRTRGAAVLFCIRFGLFFFSSSLSCVCTCDGPWSGLALGPTKLPVAIHTTGSSPRVSSPGSLPSLTASRRQGGQVVLLSVTHSPLPKRGFGPGQCEGVLVGNVIPPISSQDISHWRVCRPTSAD